MFVSMFASTRRGLDRAVSLVFLFAFMAVLSAAADAAPPQVKTINGSPLTISVGDDLSFQVLNAEVPGVGQFYPSDATDIADAGWMVEVDGALYAPSFAEHTGGTATSALGETQPFSPQSIATSGTGTQADPYRITAVASLGDTGLTATMVVNYVNGSGYYGNTLTLGSSLPTPTSAKVFLGGDIYLADSDQGQPYFQDVAGSPGGRDCPDSGAAGEYFILLIPQSPADRYTATDYSDVWRQIGEDRGLDNRIDGEGCLDNGAALQWNVRVNPGQTVRLGSATSFGEIPPIAQFNITGLSVTQGQAGSSLQLEIAGIGFVSETRFDFGTGVAVSDIVVADDGRTALVTLNIAIDAAVGLHDVGGQQVPGGDRNATLAGAFEVLPPPPAGQLQFAPTAYTVDEAAGTVQLTVSRTDGGRGAASLRYATVNGSAGSPADFGAANASLNWADGDTAPKTIHISIVDDSANEGDEQFTVVLSEATGATLGSAITATVTIIDDDGGTEPPPPAGRLQLGQTAYSVNEGAGQLSVTVTRVGGSAGAASIRYATVNGSAVAPGDYTASSGTLNWADGDSAPKTLNIAIVDDSLVEGAETFAITLGNASGAQAGERLNATVTIVDNDNPTQPGGGKGNVKTGGGALGVWLLAPLAAMAGLRGRRRKALMPRGLKLSALVFGLGIVSLSLAEPASASSDDWYLGLRAGLAEAGVSDGSLTRGLRARDHEVNADLDGRDLGGVLYAGYRIGRVGIELGYLRLGQYKARLSGDLSSPEALVEDTADSIPGAGNAVLLATSWRLPVGHGVDLRPRVGAFWWSSKTELRVDQARYTHRRDGLGVDLGFGLDLPIAEHLRLGLNWELLRADDSGAQRLTTLQLEYTL
ncbi:hypothetical protein WQQ_22380 [Hydrocarboniphaga effusa AP103]|uniref:Calx-beta domain-containing protein n=1 Tax=Hydrocarboniphaga effusa AP103 TaxID=1172194 RepID=I8I624_9GAMM|nr:hypothetical protein WQQ_22380 [Hydrocarboniphaga effusa AP103]